MPMNWLPLSPSFSFQSEFWPRRFQLQTAARRQSLCGRRAGKWWRLQPSFYYRIVPPLTDKVIVEKLVRSGLIVCFFSLGQRKTCCHLLTSQICNEGNIQTDLQIPTGHLICDAEADCFERRPPLQWRFCISLLTCWTLHFPSHIKWKPQLVVEGSSAGCRSARAHQYNEPRSQLLFLHIQRGF